jgi:diguanylate cyclase (GGDEF)-like protein
LTGLSHRRAGHRELERMLAVAARRHESAALALVEVDGLARATRAHGYEIGDRILTSVATMLRSDFRSCEIVTSWATGRFVIGMTGMSKADALQRVADVLERIRMEPIITAGGERVTVTLSGGVSEYPADGRTVDQIVHVADDAAATAGEMGGNRVLPSGWSQDHDPAMVDVAIVEDDEQLAELVAHALTTRGYRCRWLSDGVEAMEALVGTDTTRPSLKPKVVLLDVNLPGMSGMAVLRQLGEINALSRTRVVMLTARTAEADVIEALAMGAVDHVAKPFSVPVLIERLRRHLPR